ncbi:hypothetical protein CVT24_007647 [Panaeolus cyanescens]|uniref:Uncharacterized protein n=1 Tax=Panaeolus cyanescens TaxID=181874 RepID=A0A409W4T9_9AGAR|nr:hypothetical protein CVT24_007647 [Panaeolus cyanescens]
MLPQKSHGKASRGQDMGHENPGESTQVSVAVPIAARAAPVSTVTSERTIVTQNQKAAWKIMDKSIFDNVFRTELVNRDIRAPIPDIVDDVYLEHERISGWDIYARENNTSEFEPEIVDPALNEPLRDVSSPESSNLNKMPAVTNNRPVWYHHVTQCAMNGYCTCATALVGGPSATHSNPGTGYTMNALVNSTRNMQL